MGPLLIAGLAAGGMGAAGSIMGGMDAQRQAGERAAAIAYAQEQMRRLAQKEMLENYKAGGIQQGELLKHLQRLSSPEQQAQSQQFVADRQSAIDTTAGPQTEVSGVGPGGEVAQRAAAAARMRSGQGQQLGLAQALLGAQDRGAGASARTMGVAASRADIPLQEALYKLAQQRMQVEANLQNALGNVGPSWMGIAGNAMSGASALPFMFAA